MKLGVTGGPLGSFRLRYHLGAESGYVPKHGYTDLSEAWYFTIQLPYQGHASFVWTPPLHPWDEGSLEGILSLVNDRMNVRPDLKFVFTNPWHDQVPGSPKKVTYKIFLFRNTNGSAYKFPITNFNQASTALSTTTPAPSNATSFSAPAKNISQPTPTNQNSSARLAIPGTSPTREAIVYGFATALVMIVIATVLTVVTLKIRRALHKNKAKWKQSAVSGNHPDDAEDLSHSSSLTRQDQVDVNPTTTVNVQNPTPAIRTTAMEVIHATQSESVSQF